MMREMSYCSQQEVNASPAETINGFIEYSIQLFNTVVIIHQDKKSAIDNRRNANNTSFAQLHTFFSNLL